MGSFVIFSKALLFLGFFVDHGFSNSLHEDLKITIEEQPSLEGELCPGNVHIFCEGIDFSPGLRWQYSSTNSESVHTIHRFLDDMNTTEPIHPMEKFPAESAFLSVSLLSIPASGSHRYLSSILNANITELYRHNVTSISCGDLSREKAIPVNITMILLPTVTNQLLFKKVTAYYYSENLTIVQVAWTTLRANCEEYELFLSYEVNFANNSNWLNSSNCNNDMCTTFFNISRSSGKGELTLRADYDGKFQAIIQLPTIIESSSQKYITVNVNSTSCFTTFTCVGSQEFRNISQCTIKGSLDPLYDSILFHIVTDNTSTATLKLLPSAVYFIEISAWVHETFLINERMEFIPKPSSVVLEYQDIIIICITSIFILTSMFQITCTVIISSACGIKATTVYQKKITNLLLGFLLTTTIVGIALLISYGVLKSDVCPKPQSYILYSMIGISLLGILLLIFIWISWGYNAYQLRDIPKSINTTVKEKQSSQVKKRRPAEESKKCYENHDMESCSVDNTNYEPCFQQTPRIREVNNDYDKPNCVDKKMITLGMGAILYDDPYGKIEKTELERPGAGPYEQLRAKEKSRPVPNLSDSTYTHIDQRQSLSADPDMVTSHRSDFMREDYHVLSRLSAFMSFGMDESKQSECPRASFYSTLDEATFEPTGAGPYELLRLGQKSKPVPNIDDPSYSHIHIRKKDQDGPPAKKQIYSKKWWCLKRRGK